VTAPARTALFDWVDTVLVAVGFVALVGLAMLLSNVAGVDVANMNGRRALFLVVLGPSLLRRALFGMPPAMELRTGPLASMLSVLALLATFGGVGALAVSSWVLMRAFEAAPDFRAEAEAAVAEGNAVAASVQLDFPPVGETETERETRLAARAAADLARQDRLVDELAAESEESWQLRRNRDRSRGATIFGAGVLLVALGAFLERARRVRA
jgi:hypothetical protein